MIEQIGRKRTDNSSAPKSFSPVLLRPVILALVALGFLLVNATALPARATGESAKKGVSDGTLIARGGELAWYHSYSKALNEARKSRKWLLVDVYTDWCHWCKRLDKDVYENSQVQSFLNKSFVCLKANAEKGDGIGLAKKFNVNGFPCTLVLDGKGNLKGQIMGYVTAKQFPSKLSEIVKQK